MTSGVFSTVIGEVLGGLSGLQKLTCDGVRPFNQELQHETAPFAAVQSVRTGIVHQGNPFCPLQQTIEIVCIYGNLMLYSSHSESFAQVVRNKGRVSSRFGSCPSLTDSNTKWRKSRLRVSNTPMTCIPMAGSPWNGILVADKTLTSNRRNVSLCTVNSSSSISVRNRLMVV